MKIYNRVVFDMKSLDIVDESFEEYSGDVAECKSGGSNVDKAYNSRMAALAESAFNQSMMSENERKYGLHPGGFVSQMDKNIYGTTTDPATGAKTPYINKDFLASGNAASSTKNSVAAQQAAINNAAVSPTSAAAMKNQLSGAISTGITPEEALRNRQASFFKNNYESGGGA